MSIKKRYLALIVTLALGAVLGWAVLGGTVAALHYTSSTEFCVSCHTMEQPYQEYQGSVHFSNAKGIRAECSDCHIPPTPVDYVMRKIGASKDVYHEFVTGRIDTPEKYEAHRQEMAETVWARFRENDSATCRSCHSYEAMEQYAQSRDAAQMHRYAQENGETCINCHKGVAHFAPEVELDSGAFDELVAQAQHTPRDAAQVYPVQPMALKALDADQSLGTVQPTTALQVIESDGEQQRTVRLTGYQMKGAEQVLYRALGQRAVIGMLTDAGQKALEASAYEADVYGNEWRSVVLKAKIDQPVLSTLAPVWDYAETLDNVYCSTCHAKIPADHYTVNAWGPVAKSMGARTDISKANLEILTQYFQHHAKDVAHEQE